MKNFEMPKMNVAIFSLENIVTESGTGTVTPTETNLDKAQEILAQAGVAEANITVTSAQQWIEA